MYPALLLLFMNIKVALSYLIGALDNYISISKMNMKDKDEVLNTIITPTLLKELRDRGIFVLSEQELDLLSKTIKETNLSDEVIKVLDDYNKILLEVMKNE